MAQQPVGYFDYNGEQRYSDGKGGIFHNHLGPALNTVGNLDPRKWVNSYVKNNPLIVGPDGKSRVGTAKTETNPVSPSPTIQPRIERKPGPFDEGYVKPNTTMEPTEKATLSEHLNPDSTGNGGGGGNRNNSRVIPGSGGQVQKGTDMSRSFNDLLTTVNRGQFKSNSLPTTEGSTDGQQQPSYTTINASDPMFAEAFGQDLADKHQKSGKSRPSLEEALADTDGINSYMSKFSKGDQERAKRRAFLDADNSMDGLRAQEALSGVVYAGGKYYTQGEKADGPAQKISQAESLGRRKGTISAQQLKDKYVSDINDSKDTTPAGKQDPVVLEEERESDKKIKGFNQVSSDYKKSAAADGYDTSDSVVNY